MHHKQQRGITPNFGRNKSPETQKSSEIFSEITLKWNTQTAAQRTFIFQRLEHSLESYKRLFVRIQCLHPEYLLEYNTTGLGNIICLQDLIWKFVKSLPTDHLWKEM